MKIVLAGPWATQPFRDALGVPIEGAPEGVIQTPIGPLAIELLRRGHSVKAVCLDPSVAGRVHFGVAGLELVFLPYRKRARQRVVDLFEQEIRHVQAELATSDADIVHAHWAYEYAEAAVRSRLPHLVTLHDAPIQVAMIFRNLYRSARAIIAIRVLSRVLAVSVVSPKMKYWVRFHGYFGLIDLTPNGIEIPSMGRGAEQRLSSPFRIVTVGDAGSGKNVAAAIHAFRLIRTSRPEAELHLFGHGLDQDYAQGEPGVVGHGLQAHGELMRFLDREATLMLHPSLHETFGVAVAEAMARGVPAFVGRRSGGVAFVVGEELSALLIDVRKPAEMARAVLELLGEPARYAELSRLGRARIEREFSTARMVDAYEAIYARIIAGSTTP